MAKVKNTTCTFRGCEKPYRAKGLCAAHWKQQSKGKDLAPLIAPNGQRPAMVRLMDKINKTETCWVWTGGKDQHGYGRFQLGDSIMAAHRATWKMLVGPLSDELELDHICHNPSCVNPEHLRPATRKQNMEYRRGPQSRSASGVRGVYWQEDCKKWTARVGHNGRQLYLGLFLTKSEAEAAVKHKRAELYTFPEVA